jgi:hypothetical protein
MSRIRIHWEPRPRPLKPVAAAARGACSRALARKLLGWPAGRLLELKGVAGPGMIIILGDEARLPWAAGIHYLGRDSEAAALLLPTNIQPSVPVALLERAILASSSTNKLINLLPLAVLPDPPAVAPIGSARPVSHDLLEAWLEGENP